MRASRFAIAVIFGWTLLGSAIAQDGPLVQVAARLEIPDEVDQLPSAPEPPMFLEYVSSQFSPDRIVHARSEPGENEWSVTDETITQEPHRAIHVNVPVAIDVEQEVAACTCGQQHCYGVCRDPGHPRKPWITKPGDRNRGDCPPLRYHMDDCQRAGNPHCYHRWAKCGIDGKYSAWFVGGGSPFCFGRPRKASEGTWGLDYSGWFGCTKSWLNYTRGRSQGGEGAYRTDGEPRIVTLAHELFHPGH